ncbi:hypothetical protein D3C80_1382820 [compost metagenome]
MPVQGLFQGVIQRPAGRPAKHLPRLAGVQRQQAGFVRLGIAGNRPARLAWPTFGKAPDDLADAGQPCAVRAEVPGCGVSLGIGQQALRQLQIAHQRVEHVLPGAGRMGIAQDHFFTVLPGAEDIRQQALGRPVPATQYVARARRGQGHAGGTQERVAVAGAQQFDTGLAAAIGVEAA